MHVSIVWLRIHSRTHDTDDASSVQIQSCSISCRAYYDWITIAVVITVLIFWHPEYIVLQTTLVTVGKYRASISHLPRPDAAVQNLPSDCGYDAGWNDLGREAGERVSASATKTSTGGTESC